MSTGAIIITLFWNTMPGANYEACFKRGADVPVCVATVAPDKHEFTAIDPETDYKFWYKENGIDSETISYRTPKKKLAAPSLVVKP